MGPSEAVLPTMVPGGACEAASAACARRVARAASCDKVDCAKIKRAGGSGFFSLEGVTSFRQTDLCDAVRFDEVRRPLKKKFVVALRLRLRGADRERYRCLSGTALRERHRCGRGAVRAIRCRPARGTTPTYPYSLWRTWMPSSRKPRARASTTLLGVPHTSTIAELKKAYRRLCLWCHPDKNPDPRAADAFLLVCSAFELLSDPTRRKAYDASLRPAIPKPAFAKPRVYEPGRATTPILPTPAAARAGPKNSGATRAIGRTTRGGRDGTPGNDQRRPRTGRGRRSRAKPRPRSAGVEQARRRSRERAAAAREQSEAMEREAQLRREEAERRRQAGTDEAQRARRDGDGARGARRRDVDFHTGAEEGQLKHVKSTPRLLRRRERAAGVRAAAHQKRRGPRTKTRGSPSCATSRRPRIRKGAPWRTRSCGRSSTGTRRSGTNLSGIFRSRTRRGCRYRRWIGSHRSRSSLRACVLLPMMMWMSGPCKEEGPSSSATARSRRIYMCGSRTTPCGSSGAL